MIDCYKLDNGLRIACEKMPHLHSVSIGVWIATGSAYETDANNGVSHFIEHMLFKGTKTKTAMQIASSIENLGGQLNAFTGKDCTCFYVNLLNDHINIGLDVLSDIICNSIFDPKAIRLERGVILDEIAMCWR